MRPIVLVLGSFLLAALPIDAQAQEKRVNWGFGSGFTMANGEAGDHFGNGFNVNFGLQVNVTPVFAIEGLYSFNGLGDKQLTIPLHPTATPVGATEIPTDFFADMNMQYGTANLIVQKPGGKLRPYGLAGMGVYYRPVKITTPGVGYAPGYCNPWYYVCYSGGLVAVENIVGERSSTDFGMDIGGGAHFGPIYAELRYHYIWGPTTEPTATPLPSTTTTASADTRNANGQFLLTTFGVRF